ncbi:MAG TPA: PorV/PorQ family protein [Elusimicrobiales bacterium]|nr:PorV/PorQ family protein [Elusimicrobiales bacterium]
MRIIALALFLLLPAIRTDAASSSVGTASVPFLLMPAGARAVAMGGSGTASAEDATAMLWNPALLSKAESSSVSLMHSAYLESSMYDFAALNWKLSPSHALGVSVQYFTAGNIDSTDDSGRDLGTIRPYDVAASLGYSFKISGWSFGLAAKGVQSKIISTGKAFAADAGVSPPELLDGKLRIGASVSNLGGKIRYDATDEKISSALRAGARLKFSPMFMLAADIIRPNAGKTYAAGGIETELGITKDIQAALRAGYSTQPDSDGFSGAAAGVGFKTREYALDYAFAPFGALGNTHRFSLSFYWGRDEGSKPSSSYQKQPKRPVSYPGYKAPKTQNSPSNKRRYYPYARPSGN